MRWRSRVIGERRQYQLRAFIRSYKIKWILVEQFTEMRSRWSMGFGEIDNHSVSRTETQSFYEKMWIALWRRSRFEISCTVVTRIFTHSDSRFNPTCDKKDNNSSSNRPTLVIIFDTFNAEDENDLYGYFWASCIQPFMQCRETWALMKSVFVWQCWPSVEAHIQPTQLTWGRAQHFLEGIHHFDHSKNHWVYVCPVLYRIPNIYNLENLSMIHSFM